LETARDARRIEQDLTRRRVILEVLRVLVRNEEAQTIELDGSHVDDLLLEHAFQTAQQ
jgi:hypothetical protein